MYLNKVFLYGNLTRDPELKALPTGNKVASFSIATNRTWKDQNGAKKDAVEYHNLVVFGRQAETIAQYMRKGSAVFVEGRIQTRSWDAADGQKKYRTEIIVENFQFGPKLGAGTGTGMTGGFTSEKAPSTPNGTADENLESIEYPDEEINLEDIPF